MSVKQLHILRCILILSFIIIGASLFGCASTQTQENYNKFVTRNDYLGRELTLLREELSNLQQEESSFMVTIEAQRVEENDLEQQLQQLRLKEQELAQVLNTYENNISEIQPTLNNVDVECRKKIENNHDEILASVGNLLLDFVIPSPVKVASLFFKIPTIIQNIANVISLFKKANHTIDLVRNINEGQQITC